MFHVGSLSIIGTIGWTPITFHVTLVILHTLAILIGFRLFELEAEDRTALGAFLAAVVINTVGYFVRDYGMVGLIVQTTVIFGCLVGISSGEVLPSLVVMGIVIAISTAAAHFVIERSHLDSADLGGLPHAILSGGPEPTAVTTDDVDALMQ